MEIEETMEECKSIHCDVCGAVFTTKSNMLRHKRMSHGQRVLYVCNTCGTTFTRMDNLRHHEKKMHAITHREEEEQRFECSHCKARFLTEKHLNEHIKRMHRSSETYLCHTCGQVFNQKKPFMKHIKHHRVNLATSPTKRVRRDDSREKGKPLQSIGACELPPHIDPDGCIASMYREHWCHIKDRQSVGRVFRWYNFHLPTLDNDVLREKATTVFNLQSTAFKINASYGFVLFNNETNECRHYYASRNTKLFDEPYLVRDKMSFQKFMDALLSEDVLEYARSLRPDSKWVVQHITNVTFYVARLTDHPIGKSVDLPSYVSHNQAIISLSKNRHTRHVYGDNLCLFRCIALAKAYDGKSLEKMAKSLLCHYCPDTAVHKFKGVKLSDLHKIEELFKINVVVYELHPVDTNDEGDKGEDDGETGQVTATLVRRSLEKFSDTIFLNLFGNHFSYIVDIERYCQSYQCRKCNKLWKTRKSLLRHEATCNASGTSFVFPKGLSTFHNPPTIWAELADEGIVVDEGRRFFPFFATFDMESYLEKVKNEPDIPPGKLQYTSRHIPMSVSINSNVPGYTDPFCTVSEGDPLLLIDTMVTYLLEVSQRSFELLESKYADVMERIEEKITKWTDHSEQNGIHVSTKPTHLTKLKQKFVSFLSELPVIGFNSGRYDINAIKEFLYPCLLQKDPVDYVIKRNHNHMALKTKHLQFLDISNFLAPGFSYAAFLKAYDCEEGKGYFPHGWLDSLDKLNNCELPPIEAFRNNLSRTEFSDKQYEYCQRVWEEHKMTSLKDYLVWYNNQDVTPFIEAIEKMRAFYKNLKIDLFKDGISVPGLTMKYLMKCSPDAHFSLISDKDKDLYHTFRENLVGGPSIIFHRYHERGVTRIRGGKLCQKVIGFDANALYLWAIMQHMPTGHYIRRRRENDFKPEFKPPIAQEWLQYESYRRQLPIRHAGNHSEKRLGPLQIPVDGFCSETKQVFEFNGCYFHGHPCHLTKGQPFNKKLGKPMSELLKKTEEKRKYIESLGYQYISIWECEYRELRKFDHSLSEFLSVRFPPPKFRHGLTQDQLISSIANGQLFGFVQCDIHVPDHLKECFSEMCPIFKNVDITREDIGDVMRSHAEEQGIMNTPRRSLIGSMFGKNILLFTPLLQWYLNHGLVVTNISQFVEYEPVACFRQFGENVSDARRKGDVDPSKSIIADTMKLIGNSSYGKTITNKLKHRNVKICDENGAQKCINNIRYRDLNPISEDCFEVDMAKRKISLDLPVQIGHAVYQLAKLRMLQFYFDFLLRYVDSSDFQMCEMDTDSAYIAISCYNFLDVIKPHMREQFEEDKCNWFPRNDTPENARHDKRTPGLFKVIWEGDGIIALCSKTYYCFGATDKFSCKGISKKQNNITKEVYLEVLRSKVAGSGVNKGFRVVQNGISTYSQARNAFSYFYPKRKVLEDNISTTYLDI